MAPMPYRRSVTSNYSEDGYHIFYTSQQKTKRTWLIILADIAKAIVTLICPCCVQPPDYNTGIRDTETHIWVSSRADSFTSTNSITSDLSVLYYRSEEPVSLNMDISTGHTVLVCS